MYDEGEGNSGLLSSRRRGKMETKNAIKWISEWTTVSNILASPQLGCAIVEHETDMRAAIQRHGWPKKQNELNASVAQSVALDQIYRIADKVEISKIVHIRNRRYLTL